MVLFLMTAFISTEVVAQKKAYNADEISKMVVALAEVYDDSIRVKGTGLIVLDDSSKYFLITATHVVNLIKINTNIIFKNDDDTPVFIPLIKLLKDKGSYWTNHKVADISVIQVYPYDSWTRERLAIASFPGSQIHVVEEAVPRDWIVDVFGYPIVDLTQNRFSPLVFRSHFSSGLITYSRADTKTKCTFQFLENPSVQGYSGGPVFVGMKKGGFVFGPEYTILVGLVHGTSSDNTGGKMAVITPTFYLTSIN